MPKVKRKPTLADKIAKGGVKPISSYARKFPAPEGKPEAGAVKRETA